MIIWGGRGTDAVGTGARYNPANDSWTPITTTNAPTARFEHSVVWTGTEMIVWGGNASTSSPAQHLATGSRYNPTTNTWTPVSTTGSPGARRNHLAVWDGSGMIVWGGVEDSGHTDTGGKYSPTTNSWSLTSTIGAPLGRSSHTAIWTGSEMIVFGGNINGPGTDTGGRYVP